MFLSNQAVTITVLALMSATAWAAGASAPDAVASVAATGAAAASAVTQTSVTTSGCKVAGTVSLTNLSTVVALILSLSIATERLVEIIKGYLPSLNLENSDPILEGRRKSKLQLLAVVAGIVTAMLASPFIPCDVGGPITEKNWWSAIGLGLLASGGSGFWNSILGYVTKTKDLKKAEVDNEKAKPK